VIEGTYSNRANNNAPHKEPKTAHRFRISDGLKLSLQDYLIDYMRNITNNLLKDGEQILEAKKKTLGVDRNKLFNTLSKMLHHCQVIALILSKYTPLSEENNSGSGKQDTATVLYNLLESVSASEIQFSDPDLTILFRC
jgi:ABC-type microcin C transport system duplicated ATPase subunit YejF